MRRLILTGLVCTAALMAQGPVPRGPHAGGAGDPAALKQALGLTDAQVQQLRGLRREQAQSFRPAMEQMRGKSQALREAMAAPNPDPAQVGQMMVELKGMREQMRTARGSLNEKALAVLTPDQKTRLKSLEEARKAAPALRQAMALGLVAPPEGMGGMGMQPMGPGVRPRMRRAPAPGVQ